MYFYANRYANGFTFLHTLCSYLPKCVFFSYHLGLKICLLLTYCQQNGKKLSKTCFVYLLMGLIRSEESTIELESCLKKTPEMTFQLLSVKM